MSLWHRVVAAMRLVALASVLGVLTALATCLWHSYRGEALHTSAEWEGLVRRDGEPARFSGHEGFGKQIVFWLPLTDGQRRHFEGATPDQRESLLRPERRPPAWSGIWDDARFQEAWAHREGQGFNSDLAVGWPALAFHCRFVPDPDQPREEPQLRDGLALVRITTGQRPGKGVLNEVRAIPLRPIWSGIAIDSGAFATPWLVLLGWRAGRRAPAAAGLPSPRQLARLALRHWQESVSAMLRRPLRHAGRVALAGIIGVCASAAVAIVLPLVLRERSISSGAEERPGTFQSESDWWRERNAGLSDGELAEMSEASSASFRRSLASMHYAADPAWEAEWDFASSPGHFFSWTTGRPWPCLWGARWIRGNVRQGSTGLWRVTGLGSATPVFDRGLTWLPVHPLLLGWIGNTLFYAALWCLLASGLGFVRRMRRFKRGRCPICGYDLDHDLAAGCPECGWGRKAAE